MEGVAGATVAELFEASVARSPHAIAAEAGGASLTYAELDARANRLAHHLRSLGVGPNVTAGVYVERSLNLAVALVGVLKAGGACVPLDPTHPPERLALMVDDAAVAAVVTTAALTSRLPAGTALVCLDTGGGDRAARPTTAPGRAAGPDDVAYVIYTSGSTGRPKGVMLTGAGLVNHHLAVVDLYDLGPGDRVLQFCSIGFDASIEEMFPTWAAGATVVFRDEDVPILGRAWLEWLHSRQITVMDLPTAYWHQWVRDLDASGERVPGGVRLVVVGGERALGSAWRTWAKVSGGRCRWINTYGPTEASIVATSHEPPPHAGIGGDDDPPIGRPLPGVAVKVVDTRGEAVPQGTTGEMWIGGVGLARGYLNQPEATAERFLVDPTGPPGARWYRTGDVVRELWSGDLAFVGRIDDQVKIRGYRVECGEVEVALARHPAVAEAVVVASEDGAGGAKPADAGGRRLVAYVVPAPAVTTDEAHHHAACRVAEWELLFDHTQAEPSSDDPAFDAAGRVDRSTGDLLPDADMAVWREQTVAHILRLAPARVLELGCGTGLLAWRLGPHCEAYMGTDVSAAALAGLERWMARAGVRNVRFVHAEAADVGVAVNSVVAASPGLDYLRAVLPGSVGAVRPGGAVFVGDPSGAFAAVLVRGGDRRTVALPAPPLHPMATLTNGPLDGRSGGRPRAGLPRELRAHLAATVAPYMVPSAFVTLASFPLNANGKVDRRALPSPPGNGIDGATTIAAPATASEKTVAAIWAEVLGIEEVGAEDDFFELGGDSLLGALVISRARDAFGAEVPLRLLFDSLTVRVLAAEVDRLAADSPASARPLVPVERDGHLPLASSQEGLWFLDQLVPESAFYNVPATYRLTGPLDVDALRRALDEVVARHETLRTTFPSVGGRPYQRIAPPAGAALDVVDVSDLGAGEAEEEARRLAGATAAQPFDLARGPLLRTTLVRLGPEHHVLVITMHHIVSDGWSVGVLADELAALYATFSQGKPSPLPPLPVQYADFVAWQRRSLDAATLQRQVSHWTAKLADAPTALDLPTDRPRPPVPSHRGASHSFEVPPEVGWAVRALSRVHGTTPFTVLLAAFKVLLARATGTNDIVTGMPAAGRSRPELEGLIGYFVNTVALRTDLGGDPTFAEVVDRVRATTLEALDHQDLPFDRLVAALDPKRDLSRHPLVQVLFQVVASDHGARRPFGAGGITELGGLTGGHYGETGGGGTTAPFDLDVFLAPAPDGGFTGVLVFATDLFEPTTVARLAGRFNALLAAAAADPERPISQLAIASKEGH